MKINCTFASVCFTLLITFFQSATSQSTLEFIDCTSGPISLCVNDEGVRLPANNQIFLGEGHPNATSCSVQITRKMKIKGNCNNEVQFGIQLFLFDTSSAILVQPLSTIALDTSGEAELVFDTEHCIIPSFRHNGLPYNEDCTLFHRIRWIIIDACGNFDICDEEVNLYDCYRPQYEITDNEYHVQATIGGYFYLHTDTLIRSYRDDCNNNHEFQVSFNSDKHVKDSTFYACQINDFGVSLPWPIWIADSGIDSNCNGKIEWDERNIFEDSVNIVFFDGASIHCEKYSVLQGHIKTFKGHGIDKVNVYFKHDHYFIPTFVTWEDGYFKEEAIFFPANLEIDPHRDDNHSLGISTLDLIRIQKHLLGRDTFTLPHEYIAADANRSESVSMIDIIELKKLLIGIYTQFPDNNSWTFVSSNHIFQSFEEPWPFPQTYIATVPKEDTLTVNFTGIKIGDVNFSAKTNFSSLAIRESLPINNVTLKNKNYKHDEIIVVELKLKPVKTFEGFQFTLSDPNLEFIDVISPNIELSDADYALFDDKLTIAWYDINGVDHDIKLNVKARAKNSGSLHNSLSINSDITEAEIYMTNGEVFQPTLFFQDDVAVNDMKCSVQPNPWTDETSIVFLLEHNSFVDLTIYNSNGQLLIEKSGDYKQGINSIVISKKDTPDKGLLFYRIRSNEGINTGKMLLLEHSR